MLFTSILICFVVQINSTSHVLTLSPLSWRSIRLKGLASPKLNLQQGCIVQNQGHGIEQSRKIKQNSADPLAAATAAHRRPMLVDAQLLLQTISAKCLGLKCPSRNWLKLV